MGKFFIILTGIVLAIIIAILAIAFFSSRITLPSEKGKLKVGKQEYEVEVVKDIISQARGLSGRKSLDSGAGMLFIFSDSSTRAFWMKDMNFPIDIVWIREGRVVGFVQDAPIPIKNSANLVPPTFYSNEPADMVLEVPAGTVKKDGIILGDTIELIQ